MQEKCRGLSLKFGNVQVSCPPAPLGARDAYTVLRVTALAARSCASFRALHELYKICGLCTAPNLKILENFVIDSFCDNCFHDFLKTSLIFRQKYLHLLGSCGTT